MKPTTWHSLGKPGRQSKVKDKKIRKEIRKKSIALQKKLCGSIIKSKKRNDEQ
jgi:hypothetical protein